METPLNFFHNVIPPQRINQHTNQTKTPYPLTRKVKLNTFNFSLFSNFFNVSTLQVRYKSEALTTSWPPKKEIKNQQKGNTWEVNGGHLWFFFLYIYISR